jgi:hypothetical protein
MHDCLFNFIFDISDSFSNYFRPLYGAFQYATDLTEKSFEFLTYSSILFFPVKSVFELIQLNFSIASTTLASWLDELARS